MIKAYVVTEGDEGHAVVTFQGSSAAARRIGANELNLEFDEVESCCRAPQFDKYAPGPVPLDAMLADGWHFECNYCLCSFEVDGRKGWEFEDAEFKFEPVMDGKTQYCCPECRMMEWAERRHIKAKEHALIEAAATQYPWASNIRPWGDGNVTFDAPCLSRGITWKLGEKSIQVAQQDAAAMTEFIKKQKEL